MAHIDSEWGLRKKRYGKGVKGNRPGRFLFAFWLAILPVLGSLTAIEGRAQQPVADPEYAERPESLLSHSVPEIAVSDAAGRDSLVFLDARSLEEFVVSRIPGAYWVGFDDFSLDRVSAVPRDQAVVVYCSVGYRSEKITEELRAAGFEDVSNLYGGIFEWVNQGQPVEDRSGPTEKIHAYNRAWGRWLRRGHKVY